MSQVTAPPTVAVWGESGMGKSIDAVYSWAGSALFGGLPGALRGAESICGADLGDRFYAVQSLEQATQLIWAAASWGAPAVVIDDVSILGLQTFTLLSHHFAKVKDGKVTGHDWALYSEMRNVHTDFLNAVRLAPLAVHLTAHDQPAFVDDKTGEKYPEGPAFGWKKLVKAGPHITDVVARICPRPYGAAEWDTRCSVVTGPGACMKDRYGILSGTELPLNTAEALRAAGLAIPYPAGLAWIGDAAEQVAQSIVAGKGEQAATSEMLPLLQAHTENVLHIRWALRDGVHRGRFRAQRASSVLAGF